MSNYTKSTNFATKDNLTPGDPLKVVRGTEIDTEFNNIATAVATKTDNSAAAITGGTITGITDLAVADGGTGASTAAGGLNNLLPTQTGNANKYLQTDGTNATWDAVTLSTADITGTLPVANGGTGVTSSTGTGSVVLSNSPTLVTPALGTPSALVGTNITGTASGLTAGNVTTNANLTGAVTSVGNATSLGSFTSSQLAGALTDETGSGSAVFATSPTLVTPILGTPTSATLTNATGLPIGTGVSGLGTGVATFLATPSSANLRSALTDETGTGSAVFATSPTLVTPLLGTPTSGVATNLTGLPLTTGVTGTLPTANGGTNLTSFTSGGVVYASSSSALATGSALTFDGTRLQIGTSGTSADASTYVVSANGAYKTGFIYEMSGATAGFIGFNNTGSTYLGIATGTTGISASSAYPITFATSGSEGMRLTSTGLGIGTSSPAAKLDVVGASSNIGLKVRSGGSTGISPLDIADAAGNNPIILTATGNFGIGTSSPSSKLESIGTITSTKSATLQYLALSLKNSTQNYGFYIDQDNAGSNSFSLFDTTSSQTALRYFPSSSGYWQFYTNNTERARINSSGNLLVGTTTDQGSRIVSDGGSGTCLWAKTTGSASAVITNYNAATTGDNSFHTFYTETSATLRGSISYNRTAGLTAYNTTSDYRAKDISGPVTDSGALIDSVPVYMGKMKGATQERPMFIAHETPSYAHTGEKDAVDADGNPVYQQMDASALIPVMWAEIQSLRQRLSAANL